MKFNSIFAATLIALVSLMLILGAFPFCSSNVSAEVTSNYWITVNRADGLNSSLYTKVGSNWTLMFEVQWSNGVVFGDLVPNGTVTVQVVSELKGKTVDTFTQNTTSGVFLFNYSSPTADKLTFTATKVVTEDGTQYNSTLLQRGQSIAYGLKSDSITVWWDTFHVALASSNTDTLARTALSVNVTYLLIPEEGLALPLGAAFSNQTFLPKIARSAEVSINGVGAVETAPGIYTANVSTWLPTAYALVSVSKQYWTTTQTGLSLAHNVNEVIWLIGVAVGAVLVFVALAFRFRFKKPMGAVSSKREEFPLFGGVLLAVATLLSLYWVLVAVDGTLSGFSWSLLAVLASFSFVFGLVGVIFAIKRRSEAIVILAATVTLLVNLVVTKSAFDQYQLSTPWILLGASFSLSVLSGILVSNSDEQIAQNRQEKTK
jgi:hypothetical protein